MNKISSRQLKSKIKRAKKHNMNGTKMRLRASMPCHKMGGGVAGLPLNVEQFEFR